MVERLRQERLSEKPATGEIIACVGSPEMFDEQARKDLQALEKKAENIDFRRSPDNSLGVMSKIDSADKYSHRYHDCTGVIIVGQDKVSGKNISLLTHQDPNDILHHTKDTFLNTFESKIKQLLMKSKPESINVVIIGGFYGDTKIGVATDAENYKAIVQLLGNSVRKILAIDPHVVIGPSVGDGRVDIWLDTQKRRLYVIREEQKGRHAQDVSFPTSQVERIAAEIDKEYKESKHG